MSGLLRSVCSVNTLRPSWALQASITTPLPFHRWEGGAGESGWCALRAPHPGRALRVLGGLDLKVYFSAAWSELGTQLSC